MKNFFIPTLLIFVYSCHQHIQPLKTGFEGNTLPSFNLLLKDSITFLNVRNQPTEQPLVLFYFSPHCPYCRAQLNEIIKNRDVLEGIKFYLITNFPFTEMKHFSDEYILSKYSNIITGYDFNYSFASYFNPQGVPYMAIYGKDKKLKGVYMGHIDSQDIKEVSSK